LVLLFVQLGLDRHLLPLLCTLTFISFSLMMRLLFGTSQTLACLHRSGGSVLSFGAPEHVLTTVKTIGKKSCELGT